MATDNPFRHLEDRQRERAREEIRAEQREKDAEYLEERADFLVEDHLELRGKELRAAAREIREGKA